MATNTTNTFTNHTGNGTEVNFSISFTYISKTDIDVTVGGVLKTQGTHYTVNGQQITFTSGNTPANGAAIKIQRDTNISVKTVDFQDGSVLTEADLDSNTNQTLFAQQEILDKLGGIEEGATADQTDAEIRTAVGNASDSNIFTDALKSKLDAIEANATQDQTAGEIRTLVESASDSNVFTDADHTKLNNIEANATADQSNAEIKTAYEANSDTNAFTDAEKTKLAGISAGAGATSFTGLSDTPANFTSAAGKTVKVNSSANALEFVDQISDVVGDTTPQLGGDLDVQTREINTSQSNANIKLNPNGSGAVEVKGDGSSNNGKVQLNCSQNSHGVKVESPDHSAGQSYTMKLPDNQIAADKFLKVKSISGSGATAVGQLEFADAGGAGATGGGTDQAFFEGDQNVTTSYTLTANKNAMAISPTIDSGATITVPSGAILVIL